MSRWRHRVVADAGEMAETVLLGGLVASLLVSMIGILALLQAMQIGPAVGEILVFGPYDEPVTGWQIQARRSGDHRACILNPATMADAPGSMVVEQRVGNGKLFQVHWRGGRTSSGAGDCGNTADLALGLQQMQALLNASDAEHWRLFGW